MTAHVLIPTNGVHITASENPKGFLVAKYDAEGFASAPRWFPAHDRAMAYARLLAAPPPVGCGMPSENLMVVARTSREDR